MLRRLSLAVAVAASTGSVWAAQPTSAAMPLPTRTDLVSVYQDAVDNNADLAAAQADYLARKEAVPQARSGLLPQISAGANYGSTRMALDEPAATIKRNSQVVQASLSQPLFRADRWFQLKAAENISEQAQLEFSATQQRLILQSAEAYFGVLRAEDSLAASKAEEAAFKRQLDQANERFDVGLSDKTDVLESQAGFDTSRANRLVAEQTVEDALQSLTTLTNRDYRSIEGIQHSLPVVPPMPNDAKAWVDTSVQQNIALQASNYAVDAAQETLSQRKAGHLPTLDAVVQYQKGDNDALGLSNPSYPGSPPYGKYVEQRSIGVQLSVPIYSGGMTSSQVRESYQRLNQSEQQRESQRRQVVQDARNQHRAVNTDVETVKARRQAIISNQSSLEATEIGYQVGTRNIVDVLDAQRQLYSAVRDYNNARYDYILDNLRRKQTAGTLSPADLQALGSYLKADYNPDKDFLPPDLAKAAEAQLESNSKTRSRQ
ncbi:MAG: Outer membrane protein TolC [Stenotrophomonas maltophilia]|nr:MAG: Outer membrane protein TolC [Stenotrophomonas maltophilia]